MRLSAALLQMLRRLLFVGIQISCASYLESAAFKPLRVWHLNQFDTRLRAVPLDSNKRNSFALPECSELFVLCNTFGESSDPLAWADRRFAAIHSLSSRLIDRFSGSSPLAARPNLTSECIHQLRLTFRSNLSSGMQ